MSSITPLLDTLLHEVLGRRVETPAPRPGMEEVRPAFPGEAPQAVRSDSRLHENKRELLTLRRQSGAALQESTDSGSRKPDISSGQALPGDSATLSATARLISRLLANPSPQPAVLQQFAPLLMEAGAGGPHLLAALLQRAVRESGLFYESHLLNWYRGELPLQQLRQEPQAAWPQRRTPEAGHNAPDASRQTSGRSASTSMSQDETLLRQQLELLAAPVLRWQGEAWPGMMMALVIQQILQSPQQEQDEGSDADREEDAWHTELQLEIADQGTLRINLRLHGEALSLGLETASEDLLRQMQEGEEDLRRRLADCGFRHLQLELLSSAGSDDGD